MHILHIILCLFLVYSSSVIAFSDNAIDSLLALVFIFFNSAIILLLFNFDFLGLSFVIIYVGAIAVLFLFVIMMLKIKYLINFELNQLLFYWPDLFFAGVCGVFICFLLSFPEHNPFFSFMLEPANSNLLLSSNFLNFDNLTNIHIFGQIFFNQYFICFLIAGLILLVALVGAIVLTFDFISSSSFLEDYELLTRQRFLIKLNPKEKVYF